MRARAAIERRLPIGRRRRITKAPDHQLAGARVLEILRPLGWEEFDADSQRREILAPQFITLARALIGRCCPLEHERRTVRRLAPAVAVAIDITVHVEQRLGAREV